MDIQKISWRRFDFLVNDIVEEYKERDIKLIVGLSRGGLPLAVKLSNLLNIPMESLKWQTRDGDEQDVIKLMALKKRYETEEVLFVDDICDSGDTILGISKYFPNPVFATLVNKLPSSGLVEYSPLVKKDQDWITFPWEVKNYY